MWKRFRINAMTGIADANFGVLYLCFFYRAQSQCDFSFRGIFGGIAHQIVQYAGYHVRIIEQFGFSGFYVDMVFYLIIRIQFLVAQSYFLHQLRQVAFCYSQLSVLCFRLAEFQNAVYQVQQAGGAIMYDTYFVGMFGG